MSDRLETLKGKYRSVLNRMDQLGVQLENIHVQDDKLVIKGHAKNKADSNEIWNQIKLVDSNYVADLMAQFDYDDVPAAAPIPVAPPAPAQKLYTVEKGDTLSAIAKQFYGKASDYNRIFEANRDILTDPDKIKPGQVLKIPS